MTGLRPAAAFPDNSSTGFPLVNRVAAAITSTATNDRRTLPVLLIFLFLIVAINIFIID